MFIEENDDRSIYENVDHPSIGLNNLFFFYLFAFFSHHHTDRSEERRDKVGHGVLEEDGAYSSFRKWPTARGFECFFVAKRGLEIVYF